MVSKWRICNISVAAMGIKFKLSEGFEGSVELNQKELCVSRFPKGRNKISWDRLRTSNCNFHGMLNQITTHYDDHTSDYNCNFLRLRLQVLAILTACNCDFYCNYFRLWLVSSFILTGYEYATRLPSTVEPWISGGGGWTKLFWNKHYNI